MFNHYLTSGCSCLQKIHSQCFNLQTWGINYLYYCDPLPWIALWSACCSYINFSLLWELSTHLALHMPVSSSMKAFSLVMMMEQMICQRIHKEKTCSNARLPWRLVKCEPCSFLDTVTALVRATIRRQQLYLWPLWQMLSGLSSKKPSPQHIQTVPAVHCRHFFCLPRVSAKENLNHTSDKKLHYLLLRSGRSIE